MPSKFLNISTDTTLGGNAPSDELAVSQKAIKAYVDNHGGGGGGLPDQTGHAGEFLTTDGTNASWSDAVGYHPDLFDHKWADHQLNDVQWLRADTFSWQDGGVYQAAYDHLVDDIDGKTLQSETIAGTTVQFYLADDGHKICPDTQESNVAAIYAATGVAWYYIIDTTNQRFKLPRTKFGFTGIRSGVGGYVPESVPNITGQFWNGGRDAGANGAFYTSAAQTHQNRDYSGDQGAKTFNFDASRSSSAYQDNAPVQQRATEQYLYFYVGNFTQTALENTAGLNAELFNDKVDVGHEVIAFQAPTAGNNYTWYRKYADGWLEQGGFIASGTTSGTVSMPLPYSDTHYQVKTTPYSEGANFTTNITSYPASASRFTWNSYNNSATTKIWEAKGMAA